MSERSLEVGALFRCFLVVIYFTPLKQSPTCSP